MKTLFTTLGALVVIGAFLGTAAFFRSPEVKETIVGALTGPDINYSYISVSGVRREFAEESFQTATTTICSFVSPAATSTLEAFSVQIDVGTSTAATIDVGTSLTSNTSTSTALFIQSQAVAAGAQATFVLPGALPSTATSTILAPFTKVNAKTNGAGLGGYTYGGGCQAVFLVNQI